MDFAWTKPQFDKIWGMMVLIYPAEDKVTALANEAQAQAAKESMGRDRHSSSVALFRQRSIWSWAKAAGALPFARPDSSEGPRARRWASVLLVRDLCRGAGWWCGRRSRRWSGAG